MYGETSELIQSGIVKKSADVWRISREGMNVKFIFLDLFS